jgi:8-oxo-dGTP pyrophosphatase MutT (NUDIX family)
MLALALVKPVALKESWAASMADNPHNFSDAIVLVERRAVRAILLTSNREILLMQLRAPGTTNAFWITPGGGLKKNESEESALRRELAEELGLSDFELGPILARRDHTFNWLGRRIHQREQIYLVQTEHFEPMMTDAVEARVTVGFRWWTLNELRDTDERVTPASLLNIVEEYLLSGAPIELPALEIRVD